MNAREYALQVLTRIVLDHGYASMILRNRKEEFNEEDVALISEIVYGTLRNYEFLEYQWKDLVHTNVSNKTAILLNMSVYQLLFLDRVPEYAILNEANELASRKDKKFVNAILRKVTRRKKQYPDENDELTYLSITTSHPKWLLQLWSAHYGFETMKKIAYADQERPVLYGRINTLKISKEQLETIEGISFVDDICFTYDGNILDLEEFEEGAVLIQDYSSQQIAKWVDAKPGMQVLDVCSAPGTKTQQIAMNMQNDGKIIACDLYQDRVNFIDELMEKTGVTIVHTMAQDATVLNKEIPLEKMDCVLADVPCSGLGDLSHKPEIRFHCSPENLDELVQTQSAILETCCNYVKKGGVLVYSTCTLNKKENEKQIERFLKNHTDFKLEKQQTIFPFEYQSDGFYLAKLKKSEN